MAEVVPQDVYQSLRFVMVEGNNEAFLDRTFPILVEARFDDNHSNEVLIRPVGGDFNEDYYRLGVSNIRVFDPLIASDWITANRGSTNSAVRNAILELAVVIFQSPQAVVSLRDNIQQADIQNIDLLITPYYDDQGKEWPEFHLGHWLMHNHDAFYGA